VRDRLADLSRRRDQLVGVRAAELTQAKDAGCDEVARSHREAIAFLTEKIRQLDALIEDTISADPRLAEDRALLGTAPGVGPVTETILLCLMPELGSLTPKTAPALAGIVPYDHSSGLLKGHKKIAGGRRRVRRALFIAALSATRCSARYKAIYEGLRRRGKAHKQATIAVARHLLCALNAMLGDRTPYAA
jgi:transposase